MEKAKCQLCGEPMPPGEEVFNFHGYSGPCPKPPLLEPWQMSVVEEKKALDDKIGKLLAFLQGGSGMTTFPTDERERLKRQSRAMMQYSDILAERIAAFTN